MDGVFVESRDKKPYPRFVEGIVSGKRGGKSDLEFIAGDGNGVLHGGVSGAYMQPAAVEPQRVRERPSGISLYQKGIVTSSQKPVAASNGFSFAGFAPKQADVAHGGFNDMEMAPGPSAPVVTQPGFQQGFQQPLVQQPVMNAFGNLQPVMAPQQSFPPQQIQPQLSFPPQQQQQVYPSQPQHIFPPQQQQTYPPQNIQQGHIPAPIQQQQQMPSPIYHQPTFKAPASIPSNQPILPQPTIKKLSPPKRRSTYNSPVQSPKSLQPPLSPSPMLSQRRAALTKRHSIILGEAISKDISEMLIQEVVEEETDEVVDNELTRHLLSSVYSDICDEIIYEKESSSGLVRKVVQKALAEVFDENRIYYAAWFAFVDRVKYAKERRERKEREREEAVDDFYANAVGVRASGIASLGFDEEMEGGRRSLEDNVDWNLRIGSIVSSPYRRVDLFKQIGRRVGSENTALDVQFKLVLCTPPDRQDRVSRYCEEWIVGKFTGARVKSVKALACETLVKDNYALAGGGVFKLVVQRANIRQPAHLENALNYESEYSGINAAVFMFSPRICDEDRYWEEERDRLYSFVSSFPRYSRVPVLLVNWAVQGIAEAASFPMDVCIVVIYSSVTSISIQMVC
jgi:hypothetical protein